MLTTSEKLRYSRQIMVNKIGESGQLALRNATVLIVGMGGLGNPVAMYLAAAGIGKLIIADGDSVDITNLQRQILFNQQDIDHNKADTAGEKLVLNNPDVEIEVIDEMLDDELAQYYVQQADLVVDCCDNIATRYLMNKTCVEYNKPFIVGAATGFDGQQLTIVPNIKDAACYQCVFPKSEHAPENNCQTVGVIGPVLAVIAGTQAIDAIKLLVGIEHSNNRLALYDGLHQHWQHIYVKKQINCPVCGSA
ncbi:HesA/MoeB/ThiF family protein [Thalassotalea hakodatensis]|uniref:HesA/MoeB/ThiF family protein n=1 Tax=Thalassotalea hakodatensis TaxID=3030492 RepID=UPI00257447DF|nr:HesA/MoeB/ThiF family protein [Thalassotalea hakodatensis]